MNFKSISLIPSLYARSIARRILQSGPIIIIAVAIFVYNTPRAQSCQMNKIAFCSNGTRNGTTTTSSRRRPNKSGIRPISRKNATDAFTPIIAQCFILSIRALRPRGNQENAKASPLAAAQHTYIPQAMVYNSCTRPDKATAASLLSETLKKNDVIKKKLRRIRERKTELYMYVYVCAYISIFMLVNNIEKEQ